MNYAIIKKVIQDRNDEDKNKKGIGRLRSKYWWRSKKKQLTKKWKYYKGKVEKVYILLVNNFIPIQIYIKKIFKKSIIFKF